MNGLDLALIVSGFVLVLCGAGAIADFIVGPRLDSIERNRRWRAPR